jgi:hypothetical protein
MQNQRPIHPTTRAAIYHDFVSHLLLVFLLFSFHSSNSVSVSTQDHNHFLYFVPLRFISAEPLSLILSLSCNTKPSLTYSSHSRYHTERVWHTIQYSHLENSRLHSHYHNKHTYTLFLPSSFNLNSTFRFRRYLSTWSPILRPSCWP